MYQTWKNINEQPIFDQWSHGYLKIKTQSHLLIKISEEKIKTGNSGLELL